MKKLEQQHGKVSVSALLIAALIGFGSVVCHGGATLTGDFSGFSTIGDTSMQASQLWTTTINSADGAGYTPLSGVSAVTTANLAGFEGVTTTALNNLAAPIGVGEGSGLVQTLSLSAGATVTFTWDFKTAEDASGKDYAFYTLHPANDMSSSLVTKIAGPADATIPLGLGTFNHETGFQTKTITVPSTGNWLLGFGVADANNLLGTDSALVMSSMTVVPEPWAWSLVSGLALGGFAFVRRLMRRA
jgi:hypothetical protein